MFYEVQKNKKQCLSYIQFCSLKVLYNSKYILVTTLMGTNDAVMRALCSSKCNNEIIVLCSQNLPTVLHISIAQIPRDGDRHLHMPVNPCNPCLTTDFLGRLFTIEP